METGNGAGLRSSGGNRHDVAKLRKRQAGFEIRRLSLLYVMQLIGDRTGMLGCTDVNISVAAQVFMPSRPHSVCIEHLVTA
jgi:hypothetical protein